MSSLDNKNKGNHTNDATDYLNEHEEISVKRHPYLIKSENASLALDGVKTISKEEIDKKVSDEVAFWLIDMHNWQQGWNTLCEIRRNLSPKIYLKPVLFVIDSSYIPDEIANASDGNISLSNCNSLLLEEWVSRVHHINQWIANLHLDSADTNIAFKVLRIITSRQTELEPITTIRRHSGYVYPILEPLFSKRDTGVLDTLSFLESQHLLSTRFISRAHFCSHCGSAFLNFKETCTQCGADDVHSDELVHHFKCAYTAEMEQFRKGDRLSCPKCERELKHIGVDYDKPSIIYNCNQCNHSFQDPKIMTECYNCGRQSEPENQEHRTIYAYTVSAIGRNAADHGLDTLFSNILETELNLFSETAFRDFFRIELSRINRYKVSNSTFVLIHFGDIEKLYIKLGNQASNIFHALSNIFKSVLRHSDVISAKNETLFLVIMTETSLEQSQIACDRLKKEINDLFKNNLEFQPQINILTKAFTGGLELDSLLEEFLDDVS